MSGSKVKNAIKNHLPHKIDYLLLCVSFESRCLSLYEYLEKDRVDHFGVFYFKQFQNSSKKYLELYNEKFNISSWPLDGDKPTSIADAFIDFFKLENLNSDTKREKLPNVVIDVSTFTRESLLILIKYLELNRKYFGKIYIFYRVAEVSESLSEIVLQIRSVIGYMGDIESNKRLHLIVLSGFETERAKEIIDSIEPDYISIGYGAKEKSISDRLQKMNTEFTKKLIAYYAPENINVFHHSLKNPTEIKEEIEKLITLKPNHNVVIVPLNNKLSTIGAGLAAIKNPHVQICYSQMGRYNESSYSDPIDEYIVWELEY